MKPTLADRQAASSASDMRVMSAPPTRMVPLSALSMPATRFRRVLLPEPEGPMSARNSPSAMSKEMSCSTGMTWLPRRYVLERLCISTIGFAVSMLDHSEKTCHRDTGTPRKPQRQWDAEKTKKSDKGG